VKFPEKRKYMTEQTFPKSRKLQQTITKNTEISQEMAKCLARGKASQQLKHFNLSLCIRKVETGLIKETLTKGKCLNRQASSS
jgi:predicted RNase H-related nuclease YkuK (DUF458 family)